MDAVGAENLVGEIIEVDGLVADHHLDAGRGHAVDAREGGVDPALDEAGPVAEVMVRDLGRGGGVAADEADPGSADAGLDHGAAVSVCGEGRGGRRDVGGIGGVDRVEDGFFEAGQVVVQEGLVVAVPAAGGGAGERGAAPFGEADEVWIGDEAVDRAVWSVADRGFDAGGNGVVGIEEQQARQAEAEGVAEVVMEAVEWLALEDQDVVLTAPKQAEDGQEAPAVGVEGANRAAEFVGEGLVVEEDVMEVGQKRDISRTDGRRLAEVDRGERHGPWLAQSDGGFRKTAMWRSTDLPGASARRRELGFL